jgi:hypothetical protein
MGRYSKPGQKTSLAHVQKLTGGFARTSMLSNCSCASRSLGTAIVDVKVCNPAFDVVVVNADGGRELAGNTFCCEFTLKAACLLPNCRLGHT